MLTPPHFVPRLPPPLTSHFDASNVCSVTRVKHGWLPFKRGITVFTALTIFHVLAKALPPLLQYTDT